MVFHDGNDGHRKSLSVPTAQLRHQQISLLLGGASLIPIDPRRSHGDIMIFPWFMAPNKNTSFMMFIDGLNMLISPSFKEKHVRMQSILMEVSRNGGYPPKLSNFFHQVRIETYDDSGIPPCYETTIYFLDKLARRVTILCGFVHCSNHPKWELCQVLILWSKKDFARFKV